MTTLVVALFIALLLLMGYGWHTTLRAATKRATNAEVQATDLLRVNAEAAGDLLETEQDMEAERESYADSLAKAIRQGDEARCDAEWQRILHAIALGELDRVTERHCSILTLDGIRADREAGITYDGPEPPISLAVANASVVPIKRGAK